MSTEVWSILIATLVTQVMTFITIIYRDWSAHKQAAQLRVWDAADRKELAARQAEERVELARHVATTTSEIKQAIEENTQLTAKTKEAAHEASSEANHANVKIASVLETISDLNSRLLDREQKQDGAS